MKKLIIMSLMLLTILSCRKNIDEVEITETNPNPTTTILDGYNPEQKNVDATIYGYVTNEAGEFMEGATAKLGNETVLTDEKGRFLFKDVAVNGAGTYIEILEPGYFPGSHRFRPQDGSVNFVQIMLLEKTNTGNFIADNGGVVTNPEGVSLDFSANAIVDSNGDSYTGTVNVSARYLDPTSENLQLIMPGNLEAFSAEQEEVVLATYGMVAVELTSNSGEALNLGNGGKATLSIPVPATLLDNAPAEIPLWYFNETHGIWVEEGSATLDGDKYVGDVVHFTFWNWDIPFDAVDFSITVVNADNSPIENAFVRLDVLSSSNYGYGWTDENGFVSGIVPKDEAFEMNIFPAYSCDPIYTENIGPFSTDTDFGEIMLDVIGLVEVSAIVVDCSGDPITSGYLEVNIENNTTWPGSWHNYYPYYIENGNDVSFSIYNCNNETEVTATATNLADAEQSDELVFPVTSNLLDMGEVAACGNVLTEYMTITVDGITTTFLDVAATAGLDTISVHGIVPGMANFDLHWNGSGIGTYPDAEVRHSAGTLEASTGVGVLYTFCSWSSGCGYDYIEVTEMGAVGELVEGSFSGTLDWYDNNLNTYVSHDITATFSIIRD